ncbi:MAG: helix-turn-helix transcriptional regulator [Thermoleophilia bacterium]|nr:helix-turn-helix transcriptional regulator [Thermoleophilia bacterium]
MSREILELARMRDMVHGRQVRTVRLNAGLTLREVGNEVGVHPSTVHHWETGRNVPRGEAAIRYARLLFDLERIAER